MKNTLAKGITVGVLQVIIILTLGAKLLYDRTHDPRVWVQTAPVDPDLPIRGRYITLRLRVQSPDFRPGWGYDRQDVRLSVENKELIASKSEIPTGLSVSHRPQPGTQLDSWVLNEPVAFFIPEHAAVPFPPRLGEELWVEVTVPNKGRPRPIQLALKRGTEWQPLNLQ